MTNDMGRLAAGYGVDEADVSLVHDGFRRAVQDGTWGPWQTAARMRLHKANPTGFRELMAWIRAHAQERWGTPVPLPDRLRMIAEHRNTILDELWADEAAAIPDRVFHGIPVVIRELPPSGLVTFHPVTPLPEVKWRAPATRFERWLTKLYARILPGTTDDYAKLRER